MVPDAQKLNYVTNSLQLIKEFIFFCLTVASANHKVDGILVFTIKPAIGCEVVNANFIKSLLPNTSFLYNGKEKTH